MQGRACASAGSPMRCLGRCLRGGIVAAVLGWPQPGVAGPLPPPGEDVPAASSAEPQTAVLAGGDFATVEAVFRHVRGVTGVVAGYSGGTAATADDVLIERGLTGHAQSVEITFDPRRVSYGTLLQVFFSVAHDPTERDRQGPDVGKQYRSVIFAANAAQQRVASAYIAQLEAAKAFVRPIATQVVPLRSFYPADEKYQNFASKNRGHPYVTRYTSPRLAQLRDQFPDLYVDN